MNRVRLAFFLMLVCGLSVVTAAASPDAVRLSSMPGVVQMRVEVLSPSGTVLYDSDWKSGNLLDWIVADNLGHPLPYGTYRLLIRSKDLEGRTSEKETTLHVAADRVAIDATPGSDLKLTVTLHDGETGQLVTTSGDLSFRFGDFLNRKDVEMMRLSAQGDLDVGGLVRSGKGIVFPDGSIQRSAALPSIVRMRPSTPEKLQPKSDISGAGTTNQVTKWLDGSPGLVGDSAITEVLGKVGIGTLNPGGQLHIYGTGLMDVFAGMGPDVVNGPGFNYGYAGNSFGLGAGFFNVRPATGATGVNPSLRFMTVDQQRMIITNAGNVGIGTSAPSQMLDVNGNVNAATVMLSGNLALPATSSASAGVITLGGNRFLHNFGSFNTFIGENAGNLSMSGGLNTGVGYTALTSNSFGIDNTAAGLQALYRNTTGSDNTAIGYDALYYNTSGSENIGIGAAAGLNLTTGGGNIEIGNQGVAAEANTIRIGTGQTRAFFAGINGATISGDGAAVLVGANGQLGTVGGSAPTSANTPNAIVQRDGSGNFSAGTITATLNGSATNFSGTLAGEVTGTQSATVVSNAVSANTGNAIVRRDIIGGFSAWSVNLGGYLALPATTGSNVGVITLGGNRFLHNFGNFNTFIGENAGNLSMSGGLNTGVGYTALTSNSFGSNNTAAGLQALYRNTTGSDNTAIGYDALYYNTSAGENIGIGSAAGLNLTTGGGNIEIGNQGVAAEANTIRIGTGQTRAFIAGIRAVTTGLANAVNVVIDSNGQLGTASSSRRYKFNIAGMGDATDGLMRLRPVTFRYLTHGENAPLQYGLIAEEVAEIYPELVARNKDGEVETVMYQFLAPMLLNEVQKQHGRIDQQQAENQALERRIADLQTEMTALRTENASLRDQLERLMQRVDQMELKRTAPQ